MSILIRLHFKPPLENLCRIPSHNTQWWYILGDHSSGRNYRSIPNLDPSHNYSAMTYPDIIAYDSRFIKTTGRVPYGFSYTIISVLVSPYKRDVGSTKHIISKMYVCGNMTMWTKLNVVSKCHNLAWRTQMYR